jgi:CheY-like chemotaxis protein
MVTASQIRVLIVDDNADTLEWMKVLLEHDGYATQTADSGAAA